MTAAAPLSTHQSKSAPDAEAVAVVGGAPQETPAGKSDEYVSPPSPVTSAPVPLASSRRVAGLVAERRRTVPETAVSDDVGGVKSALQSRGVAVAEQLVAHAQGPVTPCMPLTHTGTCP